MAAVGKKRIRLADVARQAGVSVATVDRVIHGRPGVKKHTAEHIWGVIRQLESAAPDIHEAPDPELLRFDFILPTGTNTFIDMLEDAVGDAARRLAYPGLSPRVHRIEGFNPRVMADSIVALSKHSDGLAVIAIENPRVREAVHEVVTGGVPVVTLVSDLSGSRRIGYVGLDNRAAGRTAGYLMGRFVPRSEGKVLMLAGSLNLRDHEEREMGFRRVLRERFGGIEVVARLEDRDDYRSAHEHTQRMLQQHPELIGIYNIGGGNRGIAQALQETGRAESTVFIGHELTAFSRRYLIDGTMDAVIDQSPHKEAELAMQMLRDYHTTERVVQPAPINIGVFFRENLP
jgi:LacI family transcriptional regulator